MLKSVYFLTTLRAVREEFPMDLSTFIFGLVLKYGLMYQQSQLREMWKLPMSGHNSAKMFINSVILHIICFWLSFISPHLNLPWAVNHLRSNPVHYVFCVLNNTVGKGRTYSFCKEKREQAFQFPWELVVEKKKKARKKKLAKCRKAIKKNLMHPFHASLATIKWLIFSLPEQVAILSYTNETNTTIMSSTLCPQLNLKWNVNNLQPPACPQYC